MSRQSILNRCAREHGVAPQFLEYCGTWDERRNVGRAMELYHIEDPAHEHYKSTVAAVVTDDRGANRS